MSYLGAEEQFKKEMHRMRTNYGEQHFSGEKCAIIWEELKDFSIKQIMSICDHVIGENEHPPRLLHFREKASQLREKIRQWEREQLRQDAKDFWEGTFHSDEVKSMVQTIKLRMEGKVTDDEWRQFKQLIERKDKPPKCKKCDDTGIFLDHQQKMYKCYHDKPPIRPIVTHALKTERP